LFDFTAALQMTCYYVMQSLQPLIGSSNINKNITVFSVSFVNSPLIIGALKVYCLESLINGYLSYIYKVGDFFPFLCSSRISFRFVSDLFQGNE